MLNSDGPINVVNAPWHLTAWVGAKDYETAQALQDTSRHQELHRYDAKGFPILPVVPESEQFDFEQLPQSLAALAGLNALGWTNSETAKPEGMEVFEAIEAWLGLRVFPKHRKFFISYRRSDGTEVAQEVHRHFEQKGYQLFLDMQSLEGGEKVQPMIYQSIVGLDLIVLIDSPNAPKSEWVKKEIQMAIRNRIKILVLKTHDGAGIPLTDSLTVIRYRGLQSLPDVEKTITEHITSQVDFDRKVLEFLRKIADLKGYALHQKQAVTWAKQKEPLAVIALSELATMLK